MPTYSYCCNACKAEFELFFYIKDYIDQPICIKCKSRKTHRLYIKDISTLNTSVKKSDSELKTLGDLAQRNSEKMSDDHKQYLYAKHNSYKDNNETKPLPTGMSRVEKKPKIKWPGTTDTKIKRKPKNG